MFTKDGVHTLIGVVTGDPMWVDLLPQSCGIQGFVAFDVTQTKERVITIDTPLINFSI
jgi:hypothetical protein